MQYCMSQMCFNSLIVIGCRGNYNVTSIFLFAFALLNGSPNIDISVQLTVD